MDLLWTACEEMLGCCKYQFSFQLLGYCDELHLSFRSQAAVVSQSFCRLTTSLGPPRLFKIATVLRDLLLLLLLLCMMMLSMYNDAIAVCELFCSCCENVDGLDL
ncbi:hypothetical protein QVD17_18638 [Tagetes erecta]|uniref:Uncharacterized protein n=1 Tax=Tagetes erecta TaxID=13708 RepID=A0AAD8KIH6_TARER|nr:hypothetical protein QVD17_18638 [Tagetes erecta]